MSAARYSRQHWNAAMSWECRWPPQKTQGPTTKLVFLGIEISTVTKTLRLPEEKRARLQATIGEWQNKWSCTKRDLLSLIGQLHVCCVVRPGRTFLRRMINLVAVARKLHYKIRLNAVFRADLRWWATFLSRWNGVGMIPESTQMEEEVVVTSDASGSWNCGAFVSTGEWFQLQWLKAWDNIHITTKELLPDSDGSSSLGPAVAR